ncbi:MAG: serine/threonine protein kinase [Verrucomicrobiae bacterium]|nr:serine/threonine protein kinase [Verrucomicrobiae bacterium]
MTPPHREKEIFEQALDIGDPAEREAFLLQSCAGDDALLERVQALLVAHEVATAFLPGKPGPHPPLPANASPGEQPGEVIGRYKLLEKLGEGGCGVVYVAEQTEPVRRCVALKIIKLGMDTQSVVARFEGERQALALMDHPNIAKVLDGGATARGRPYFVMERVHGIPITEYCDQNHLCTVDRLNLFIQVCQAIQHAHQKGVIHRDIKPSNILVGDHDGVPVPKIIDFGIAKATEGKLGDATVVTQLHQFIGTPAYMSPEQAEMTSLDVDTRSDIYSLGVLLYELLSGRTPFEPKRLMAVGLDAMRRMVREQEPVPPSTRLATLGNDEQSTTAKRRSTEPPRLLRQLRGDLDWIVMRCLEKDRTRRYETANGLADDLRRHLNCEPVLARPPSAAYRLRKALRRNRAAFGVALAIACVLVMATAFSAWQAERASREAQRAGEAAHSEREARREAVARAHAESEAREEAEALARFLGDLFRSPDPNVEGRNVTVAATLGRAAERVARELAGQPGRQATLRTAMAETYLGLSLFREAAPLFEQVLAYRHEVSGPDHPLAIELKAKLASARHGLGRWQEAAALREEVVTVRNRQLPPEHPDRLSAMIELAYSWNRMIDRQEDALRMVREVLEIRREHLGPDHTDTRNAELSLFYMGGTTQNSFERHTELAAANLEQTRREKGQEHPDTIGALMRLALYTPFGDASPGAEKIRLSEQALELSRRVLGPEHQETRTILNNLAWFQLGAGRTADAIRSFEEVVALGRKLSDPNAPNTLQAQMKLAEAYARVGRIDEAAELGEAAVLGMRQSAGDTESLGLMEALGNLYLHHSGGTRWDDAIRVLEESHAIARRHDPNSTLTASRLALLATAMAHVERHDEAAALCAEAEREVLRTFGPDSRGTAFWLVSLGRAFGAAHRPNEAIRVLEAALPLFSRLFGSQDPNTYRAGLALASALFQVARPDEAMQLLENLSTGDNLNPESALDLAVLQLWRNDPEGHERTRARLLAWSPGIVNPVHGGWVGRLAGLRDYPNPSQAAQALALAQRTVETGREHPMHSWFLLALGMAQYRSGLYPAAVQTLIEADDAAGQIGLVNRVRLRGIIRLYRSMCLSRTGDAVQARQLFEESLETARPWPVDGRVPPMNEFTCNDFILALAAQEARLLLRPSHPDAAP